MYGEDVKMSSRHKRSLLEFVNASIDKYNELSAPEATDTYVAPFQEEANSVMNILAIREAAAKRYNSFSETVRNSLVVESIYNIYKNGVPEALREDAANISVMRGIVNGYVTETGYENIMFKMKTASVGMSTMHNIISKSVSNILESVDKTDPETFKVTPEMRDEFFKQLDFDDAEAMSDAINNRVANAMEDFVTANKKDHDDITAALQQAQEKVADVDPSDGELREFYEGKAKRQINQIRNAPKGVFHAMVTSVCESVMKSPNNYKELMTENHLNMPKIVDRVTLLYSFMETLNTTRLADMNESAIAEILEDLKK